MRIGVITTDVKLGDNWCNPSYFKQALYLDTFFGVLYSGDQIVAAGPKLKSAIGT